MAARAPVAQWIERRPPEPSRLSVVAPRVGPRAKRVEFYALSRMVAKAKPNGHREPPTGPTGSAVNRTRQ
jgi:uncharacterized membrane protein YebE (DUF533 family)